MNIGDTGILIDCPDDYNDYIGQNVEVAWVGSTVIVVRTNDGNEFYVAPTDVEIL